MASKKLQKKSPPRKRARKKKEKTEYYVNAKDFRAQIAEYYENPCGKNEREIGSSIYKIATGLSFAPNFINYSYKDDMIGDAIVKMWTAITNKKFNIESEYNPFSYFTTIAFHAFINRIKKEKKHHDVVQQYQETIYDQLITTQGAVPTNTGNSSGNSDNVE